MLNLLTAISSVRLYIPKDLRPYDNRQSMLKSIQVTHTHAVCIRINEVCVVFLEMGFFQGSSRDHNFHNVCSA